MSSSDTQPTVCPECGAAVPGGARVCPQCRVRLDDDGPAGRSDTVVESSMVKQLDQERGRQGLGPAARKPGAPGEAPRRTFERKYGPGAQRRRDEQAPVDSTPVVSAELVDPGRERAARVPSTDRLERAAPAARSGPVDRLEPDDALVRPARRGLDRVERQAPPARDAALDRIERRGPPSRDAVPARTPEPAPAAERDDRFEDERAPSRGDDRFEARAAAPAGGDDALRPNPPGPAPRAVALVATELEDALEGGLHFGHAIDLADKLSLLSAVALVICTMLPWSGAQMGILIGGGPVWLLAAATVALVVLRQRRRAHAAEGMLDDSGEADDAPGARRADPASVRRLNLLQIFTGVGAVAYLLVVALGIFLVDKTRLDLRFGWFAALFFAMGLAYSGIARFVRDAVRS